MEVLWNGFRRVPSLFLRNVVRAVDAQQLSFVVYAHQPCHRLRFEVRVFHQTLFLCQIVESLQNHALPPVPACSVANADSVSGGTSNTPCWRDASKKIAAFAFGPNATSHSMMPS